MEFWTESSSILVLVETHWLEVFLPQSSLKPIFAPYRQLLRHAPDPKSFFTASVVALWICSSVKCERGNASRYLLLAAVSPTIAAGCWRSGTSVFFLKISFSTTSRTQSPEPWQAYVLGIVVFAAMLVEPHLHWHWIGNLGFDRALRVRDVNKCQPGSHPWLPTNHQMSEWWIRSDWSEASLPKSRESNGAQHGAACGGGSEPCCFAPFLTSSFVWLLSQLPFGRRPTLIVTSCATNCCGNHVLHALSALHHLPISE